VWFVDQAAMTGLVNEAFPEASLACHEIELFERDAPNYMLVFRRDAGAAWPAFCSRPRQIQR
jgi:hypothetical protein